MSHIFFCIDELSALNMVILTIFKKNVLYPMLVSKCLRPMAHLKNFFHINLLTALQLTYLIFVCLSLSSGHNSSFYLMELLGDYMKVIFKCA